MPDEESPAAQPQEDPLERIADALEKLPRAIVAAQRAPRPSAGSGPFGGVLGIHDSMMRAMGIDPEKARQRAREAAEAERAGRAEVRANIAIIVAVLTALAAIAQAIAGLGGG